MKPAYFSYSILWITTACFLIGGCGNAQEQSSIQSASDEMTRFSQLTMQSVDSLLFTQAKSLNENLELTGTIDSEFVIAYSFIEPVRSLSTIRSYQSGTLIHLSLDDNLTITARLNRNHSVGDAIRTLTGPLLDPHSGNIILSIDEDVVTGSIDLISEKRLFHIRYDRDSDYPYLAEVDRSILDILEGSEPLEY